MTVRFDPQRHHWRSIRLTGYDYAGVGAYFISIVTQARACLFGDVVEGVVRLNAYGEIVRDEWQRSAQIRPEIEFDVFVIMPNHVHGIVVIRENEPDVGAHGRAPLRGNPPLVRSPRSLGSFVASFKSATTKRINHMRGTPGTAVWQRNYYEHIIRDESALKSIRQYLVDNPVRWAEDPENPARQPRNGDEA